VDAIVGRTGAPAPSVALFPWGDVIEDYLDPLGLSVEDFAGRMGGGWLFGYAKALQRQGLRPVIVCASAAATLPRRLVHAETGTSIWVAPGRRLTAAVRKRPSLLSFSQWCTAPIAALSQILRRENCQTLLAQEYEYPRFDLLVGLARLQGRRVFATFQGGDVTLSAAERLVRPLSLAACDGLIVASAVERARLAVAYPSVPLRVAPIPNPLDVGDWPVMGRDEARRRLGLPEDVFLVVNHGRVDILRKGLDTLVEAWSAYAASAPEAQLVVIGSGQDHAAFDGLLKDRRPPQLRWLSTFVVDRAFIRTWLSAADVYITTSRHEGMPVAPLEAMACGLPVVATDAQGLPEIFPAGEADGGIVVKRDDVASIAAALSALAAEPARRATMGRAARRRVEDGFSIDAVGRQLAGFLAARARSERVALAAA
jgi:starch synthase